MIGVQIERLVPCQLSAYQKGLNCLVEGEVQAGEEQGAGKGLKRINNTLMELRTICNHPLIRCLPTSDLILCNAVVLCCAVLPVLSRLS